MTATAIARQVHIIDEHCRTAEELAAERGCIPEEVCHECCHLDLAVCLFAWFSFQVVDDADAVVVTGTQV